MNPLLALPLGLATAAVLAQGAPTLLADVETGAPTNPGSLNGSLEDVVGVAWNSFLYFPADADGRGKELWRTSGGVGSAELVVDLHPSGGAEPRPIGVIGGWLLFTADDGLSGREIWRTTGTAAGTSLLRDIVPGSGGSHPHGFVRYGNWYYFLVGGQLWKTDGSTGNTIAVSQTNMNAQQLVAAGSQLFLVANNNGTWEIWQSDGGSSVSLVSTLPNEPLGLTGLPGINAVFACTDATNGTELWKTSGTLASTQLLLDLRTGPSGSGPTGFTALGNLVLFRCFDGSGHKLYRTDGTAAGTTPIDTGNGPRSAENITACGNRVFMKAQNGAGQNSEVWTSDGTVGGTFQVHDVWPGSAASGASGFRYDGTQWTYFRAHDGSTGYELWRTDTITTQRVSDIQPGLADSSPIVLGFVGVSCVFRAVHNGTSEFELYASQGNASQLVRDLRTGDNGSSSPERITAQADGRFWFAGRRAPYGNEPHFSDGTGPGTQFLVNTYSGSQSGMGPNTRAASWGGYTFFNNVPGSLLWRTAGTPASTNPIPGLQVTFTDIVEFAGKLYFDAITAATGEEVFVLDSPFAAPVLLKDCLPGNGGTIRNLCVVGNRLFFSAQDPQSQPGWGNLWVSDGTPAGTQQVYVHGQSTAEPQQLRALGRRVVFTVGQDLVISDGTAAGTQSLGSFYATHERVVSGDRLFLAGQFPGSPEGVELCVTDGSTISLVKDIRPGGGSSDLYSLVPFGNGVLFVANDGSNGFELWKSDGTAAGTQMVVDLIPGPASGCYPTGWNGVAYDGFVYAPAGAQRAVFLGNNGASGFELWRTDGTAAGTALHADLQPGPLGSWPGKPVRCGNRLAFAATQTELPAAAVGRELFTMPSMAAAEPVGTPCSNDLASAPLARGQGTPHLGNAAFALRVEGTPSTAALLVIGFPADQSQAPCELRFTNPLFSLLTFTDAQGLGQLGLPLGPDPAFAGLRLGCQWGLFQNGGPYLGLAALSNGVDLVVQSQ